MGFSQLLVEKIDAIAAKWVEAVRIDRQISSADDLPRLAIQNHLTDVLTAMATVLSQFQESDIQSIIQASLAHGFCGLHKVKFHPHRNCTGVSSQQWSIAVSDTGVGIAPEDQARVFDPFFRADNIVTHVPDSTGLGLAIVSQLVELMQGKIELVSQVGVGSTFTVILPLQVKTLESVT